MRIIKDHFLNEFIYFRVIAVVIIGIADYLSLIIILRSAIMFIEGWRDALS